VEYFVLENHLRGTFARDLRFASSDTLRHGQGDQIWQSFASWAIIYF
jgi:hypothetical protein